MDKILKKYFVALANIFRLIDDSTLLKVSSICFRITELLIIDILKSYCFRPSPVTVNNKQFNSFFFHYLS